MTWLRAFRAELRKLTTTRLPWGFLAVLLLLAGAVALAVTVGIDYQGAEGFVDNEADQASLLTFGPNAMMVATLFGAIVTAREYTHGTIVPTLLMTPRRLTATSAQMAAVTVGGAVLGLVGGGLAVTAGALSFPAVGHQMMVSAGWMVRLVASAGAAGAAGALMGAGIGVVVRNAGGAAMVAAFAVIIAPPMAAEIFDAAGQWIPSSLITAMAGVNGELTVLAAVAALAAWGLIPAVLGVTSVARRDAM